MTRQIEILAPAGSPSVLDAALNAGASAVYLGLKSFNARRGAANFSTDELASAVEKAHAAGAKVYLTLNIDLAQRELNQTLRAVQLASDVGVDALLVKDPALLALISSFPGLRFHFSTQAGISNSGGMLAAEKLGISRCVLARELTLSEVEACGSASSVETEVFVQGALCFSVSGRCLMSSWVGGRSGNRGCCASPCRVPWSSDVMETGCKPFSMHDLSLSAHVSALSAAGVDSFKIEGRLKNVAWVDRAVRLFRMSSERSMTVDSELGAYAGRSQTDGYLIGNYQDLTGDSGRIASSGVGSEPVEDSSESADSPSFSMTVDPDSQGGMNFGFTYQAISASVRVPPRPVKKVAKALTLQQICDSLCESLPESLRPCDCRISGDPEMLFVPTSYRQVEDAMTLFVRKIQKPADVTIRYPLPDGIKDFYALSGVSPENKRKLGIQPDRARVDLAVAAAFAAAYPKTELLIQCRNVDEAVFAVSSLPLETHWMLTFPQVLFEADYKAAYDCLAYCKVHRIAVELNSWDMWYAAVTQGITDFEAGPGLAVLNAAAARELSRLGFRCAMISPEADRLQVEGCCQAAETPLSMTVYGRPILFQSRVPIPECVDSKTILSDGRSCRIRGRMEGELAVYRPVNPFNLSGFVNPLIKVAHLTADLTAAPDPVAEFEQMRTIISLQSRFNYERTLR